ncbi:MAG TPA: N-acetyl-alpha-D-glucosaminyl L-malate synthase BshA [Saprospiraceae bacterium]|nr:N-acetyl-alpha-D-glucosaminyl L-malate synthase BshA [Saprospiraceae bacterium]MCB9327986.1 N-acetyl-alpha-D-glucosaminyl L-malate synthase BshA [Lewinellaceae bacterium]HPK08905.1 N-acetyl-alpha-D-glucosaminyl L-malate synthase BshA [Saprospiraceae bacterium]HPQ20264.1 N-acetyl-alpha-D-glucosaminyl L-malate synthase BshA [Saprospiraceae bacterium]HRX28037.1 N-acetyl-alpha-D-glucosaminyl L-malate synthase BshA [Saprospiraceae bacterium]
MKIGIVCYPTYGGSGVVATELGLAMAKEGHQVHFITYKRPARLISFQDNVYFHEVNAMDYPLFEYPPYETALASKMVDVVNYEKLDLLHVHYAIPHAAVAYMAKNILKQKGIDIPVITTLHGTDITLVGQDASFYPVVEFSINQSDGVTAVSEHLAIETLEKFKINKEIKVIYNFIDFNRFKKTDKNHFKKAIAPNGEKIIVHTSNFRKVKRVDDVIKTFEMIRNKIPSKLLLVGDGPERRHLEELCRALGLCDDIRFLGKQDAIEEILALADLFIIPSENESFGLAALEAMACEVPVISTDIGGLPEVNIDGVTGYLCALGDTKDMAEKAIYILSDEKVHDRFKLACKEQAERFDIKKILPQYEEYYASFL